MEALLVSISENRTANLSVISKFTIEIIETNTNVNSVNNEQYWANN